MDDFEALKKLIEQKLNVSLDSYRESYLKRRIDSRLRFNKVENYSDYMKVLERDQNECRKLEVALTINVTEFFRDPRVWEALADVAGSLVRSKGIVRTLSAGCSTGEEAYSMAILLKEAAEREQRACYLRVYGVDIDRDAVEVAKKGVYKKIDGHGQWFSESPEGYVVKDEIKTLVKFECGDITKPMKYGLMDVVLCRNVLIYMDAPAHEAIIKNLCASLCDGGYLVLGMTESLTQSTRGLLQPYNRELRIYQISRRPLDR